MNPENQVCTQSSLLIPEKYLDVFHEQTEQFSREEYFHILLKRYRNVVLWGTFAKSVKVKTCYQEEGQNLVKKNFRPNNSDWIEFGLLANWLGISRTALFTLFLILDLAGWDELLPKKFFDDGVPPNISSLGAWGYLATRKTIRADRHIRYKVKLNV